MNNKFLQSCSCLCVLGTVCHAQQKPNIILIMTDDQGYGEFSCNGNPIITTPHIDLLAKEGIRLQNFHASSMSTPTRGQLMTGMDAFRNGAMNVSSGRTLLRANLKTMADIFKENGYSTGMFGKWHLGDSYPYRPTDRGFDEAVWYPSSRVYSLPDTWENDYFDDVYIHNTYKEQYRGYSTSIFVDSAINWMRHQVEANKPFFTYIPTNLAHGPLFVPEKYREAATKMAEAHPEILEQFNQEYNQKLISYLAMALCIDDNVGKVNQFIEDNHLGDNTVVIFLTDNGGTFTEYYNAGMRGRKVTLWEGGHRVPCFIKAPKSYIPKSKDVTDLTQVQDLYPTLCDMANLKGMPEDLDGISLYPIIRGDIEELEDRMLVINYSRMPVTHVEYTDKNPAIPDKNGSVVLWKDWRLIENRYLYNVKEDPHQDCEIAAQHPDVVAVMRRHLDEWWERVKDDANEIQYSFIGNVNENPVKLTACEWLDVFCDQQGQVRSGRNINGVWHVNVDASGDYEFELRRWPREAGYALTEAMDSTPVTDQVLGPYPKGNALPIKYARIKVGNQEQLIKVSEKDKCATFKMNLKQGHTTIQTWFLDKNQEQLCGAYFLYVTRKLE